MSHRKHTRRHHGALWYVWCSCGWMLPNLTKIPDLAHDHHLRDVGSRAADREMRSTPGDYRGRA